MKNGAKILLALTAALSPAEITHATVETDIYDEVTQLFEQDFQEKTAQDLQKIVDEQKKNIEEVKKSSNFENYYNLYRIASYAARKPKNVDLLNLNQAYQLLMGNLSENNGYFNNKLTKLSNDKWKELVAKNKSLEDYKTKYEKETDLESIRSTLSTGIIEGMRPIYNEFFELQDSTSTFYAIQVQNFIEKKLLNNLAISLKMLTSQN